jgi:tetratricopeptide (TPR) repeat protein
MFSSDNTIGGFHNDVLNATPADDESALKLIDEIKNRAKGCIPSKNYPGAIKLYTKAIEVCPESSINARAILFSNRSMCHLGMSNNDKAIEDADQSIEIDPSYMKGYFRKVVLISNILTILTHMTGVMFPNPHPNLKLNLKSLTLTLTLTCSPHSK